MVCEMFPVGTRHFRLPGLGSYLQTAANNGDTAATIYGIITMMVIIVLTDQLVWRPLIAWSDKFKFETTDSGNHVTSPILHLLRNSTALAWVQEHTIAPLSERIYGTLARRKENQFIHPAVAPGVRRVGSFSTVVLGILAAAAVIVAAVRALGLLRQVPGSDYLLLFEGAAATFLRVNAALLIASLWTIPVGVAIGFNPRLARIMQPIIQMVASFPATVFYPIIILGLFRLGIGLGIGSVVLMLLGTQWYVLFNVIAGAMAIPSEMREVADLFHFSDDSAMDDGHSSRHLSLSGHRAGDCIGRRVERLDHRRVLPSQGAHHRDARPRRADQRSQRLRQFWRSVDGDHHHGDDGGYRQPPAMATAVSPCRDEISAGLGSRIELKRRPVVRLVKWRAGVEQR